LLGVYHASRQTKVINFKNDNFICKIIKYKFLFFLSVKGPLFGRINFNPLALKDIDLENNDIFEYWTEVIMHEIMHILGFSYPSIPYWVDPSTKTFHTASSAALLTETITLDGVLGTLI
jgi:hypothetical protein